MRKQYKKFQDEAQGRRYRKKLSIRAVISGSAERPRLCVIKSNKHLSVQVIDDVKSETIFSLNTFGKNAVEGASKTVAGAKVFGAKLAEVLKSKGHTQVVFDRNGRAYKGILASLADSIRENGIKL